MFAPLRAGGVLLCLAALLAGGCGPSASTPGGTPPSAKAPPTEGKPVTPPKPDRG